MLSRRHLLTAAAFTGFARAAGAQDLGHTEIEADPYLSEVAGYGPLGTDPRGLFDLPEGFRYTIVSRAGDAMSDSLVTPYKMDGMGCFPAGGDRVALVRNHELKQSDLDLGPFGVSQGLAGKVDASLIFDRTDSGRALTGGTTTLIYDLRARRLVSDHASLVGTSTNCAGGQTPWGSWLSCEEVVTKAGGQTPHGWVFEVPSRARGLVAPVPLKAMGRFKHEAACVDPRTGVVYLTEDEGDGLFYRFLPAAPGELAKGGRLQTLAVKGLDDSRNWSGAALAPGVWVEVAWLDMEAVESPDGDLRLRGAKAGGTRFARGEGVHFGEGELYFTCTSGGPGRLGQVFRYKPSRFEGDASREAGEPGRLQLFVEPKDKRVMNMADNLTIAPWGHLIICEDKSDRMGVNYLRGVTPEGRVYTLGRQAQMGSGDTAGNTELAGACFSPDGSTLFVNAYFPGVTFAITGPWSRFRNA